MRIGPIALAICLSMSTGCSLFWDIEEFEHDPPVRNEADAGVAEPDATPDVGPEVSPPFPDVGAPDAEDAGEIDMAPPCMPETDEELCGANAKDCGEFTTFDRCDTERVVQCGQCDVGDCSARSPNVCGCPCEINGRCYPDGAFNPGNPCQICDPMRDPSAWSIAADALCDDGNACTVNDRCDDTGACVPGPVVDCSDLTGDCTLGVCNTQTGLCEEEARADGFPCTDEGLTCTDDMCVAGQCNHLSRPGTCAIDGACWMAGDPNPDNPCQACDPDVDRTTWSPIDEGASCGAGVVSTCAGFTCQAGDCKLAIDPGGCFIDDTCYAAGEVNPDNECQECDPAENVSDWHHVNDGTVCGPGNPCRCDAGACLRPNNEVCM